MVVEEKFEGTESFRCEECGFHFEERQHAEQCEERCRESGICGSEVTERSLERRK